MRLIYFFLFFLLNINIFSQNIDETTFSADEMFKNDDYLRALELYKRASFFSKGNKYYLLKKTGDCYFNLNKFQKANNYYDSAKIYCNNKNEILLIDFLKVDCNIFLKRYKKANNIISNIKIDSSNNQIKKKNFYLGIINFAQTNYDSAEFFFINSVSDTSFLIKDKIHNSFKKKRKLKRPNPKIAGTLSIILPGSGQLYAGDYKNAINSFLLVAVFTAIGADMYFRYAWYDSTISVFPWFYRYYRGGYKNAMKIAKEKRNLKRNKKLNEIIDIIKTQ